MSEVTTMLGGNRCVPDNDEGDESTCYRAYSVHECVLFFCVRTYEASVDNGVLNEKTLATFPNRTTPEKGIEQGFAIAQNASRPTAQPTPTTTRTASPAEPTSGLGVDAYNIYDNVTISPNEDDEVFTVYARNIYILRQWTAALFQSKVEADVFRHPDYSDTTHALYAAMVANHERETGTTDDGRGKIIRWWDPVSPEQIMNSVALSLTNTMRMMNNESALGDTSILETYVQIRWYWASLPLAVVAMSLIYFLVVAIINARMEKPVWKNSVLPAFALPLDGSIRDALASEGPLLSKMEWEAQKNKTAFIWTGARSSGSAQASQYEAVPLKTGLAEDP